MDFEIKKNKKPNTEKYEENDTSIAFEFAKRVNREMEGLLKGVVLFGSTARKKTKTNDIDILLVLDDVTVQFTPELIQTYRIIVEKIVLEVSKKIHVTTMRFTSFWEYTRAGDPIAINILRDGVALIDSGFFEPLQFLLYQGRIAPSKEAVWSYYKRAPMTIENASYHLNKATLDLYWAVIDSAHAALMSLGEIPPSPAHVSDLLEEKMVKTGLLESKYSGIMRKFYDLSKMITTRKLEKITGTDFDSYLSEAKDFVERMKKFVE